MERYARKLNDELKKRIEEPRRFIQVIAGPRQVGKSTMVEQVLSQINIPYMSENADIVDEQDSDWIRRTWESARAQMKINGYEEYLLVIDEIQKIEKWSSYVKKEWDYDTRLGINLKVVLLGSSRLLLRKGLSESLSGRFELLRMNHWTYQEMHDAFGLSLDQYIYFGGYPGSATFIGDEKRWRRYIKDSLVAPAIEKDVIGTAIIYKPALMSQLFNLGCSYSGELLSLTKAVGQLQDAGNVTTLANYIEILNQCNLLTGLQKFANDDSRKYNSVPKFQVYNNALLSAFRSKSFEATRIDPIVWGRWVESAIGAHLLSQADELGYKVLYWRDRDNEVDFIVAGYSKTIAIEVKSGRRAYNKGMSVFCQKFKPDMSFVVGTEGVPVEDFLKLNIERLF